MNHNDNDYTCIHFLSLPEIIMEVEHGPLNHHVPLTTVFHFHVSDSECSRSSPEPVPRLAPPDLLFRLWSSTSPACQEGSCRVTSGVWQLAGDLRIPNFQRNRPGRRASISHPQRPHDRPIPSWLMPIAWLFYAIPTLAQHFASSGEELQQWF